VSRLELEAVMGRVITSRAVAAEFSADPLGFAAAAALEPAEREWLVTMCADLTALTPEFVSKRSSVLEGTARRTLGMLGDVGEDWLSAYVDEFPPIPISGNDGMRWLTTLAANIEARAGQIAHPTVVRAMARLELMRHRAFRTPGQPGDAVIPEPPYAGRLLRMHPASDVAHLDHDLLGLRDTTVQTAATVPDDPCDVLVFRTRRGVVREERISDPVLLEALIELSGGPIKIDDLITVVGGADTHRVELVRWFRWGALTE
jgi:hypothetical protein